MPAQCRPFSRGLKASQRFFDNLILNRQSIFELAVLALAQICIRVWQSICCAVILRGSHPPDTAFEHVPNAEFAADLLNIG